jgi:dCMP deaminase
MNRPNWDEYFMNIAKVIATRGTCDRARVGAVIVKDNRIVSTGYNGSPPGLPHCDDIGHEMVSEHCVRTLHAEENAMLQAAIIGGTSTKGATMYTTHSTCYECLKKTISVGITRIVSGKTYRNPSVVELAENVGIECTVYDSNVIGNLIDDRAQIAS